MAKILITKDNGEVIETQGKMTFETIKREDEDGIYVETIGQLAIHEYIEDIASIESARYLLRDIDVYREVFGTDDFNILYEFKLLEDGDMIVKESNMSKTKIKEIQFEEYQDEFSKKWDGDYEWMSEMK